MALYPYAPYPYGIVKGTGIGTVSLNGGEKLAEVGCILEVANNPAKNPRLGAAGIVLSRTSRLRTLREVSLTDAPPYHKPESVTTWREALPHKEIPSTISCRANDEVQRKSTCTGHFPVGKTGMLVVKLRRILLGHLKAQDHALETD
jgi:hypothetical protein